MLTALLAATLLNATYVSERCGFTFEYPDGWIVIENPQAGILDYSDDSAKLATCALGIKPRGYEKLERDAPFPIQFIQWNRRFADAASDAGFFRVGPLDDETPSRIRHLKPWDWAMSHRGVEIPAYQFTTSCCQGVRGPTEPRQWHDRDWFEWEVVVVNDRNGHSLKIEAVWFPGMLTRLIENVRFGR